MVRQVDPTLPLTDLRTVSEQVDRSSNIEHMPATLSGIFGTLALLLSPIGLYGVMTFVVTQRTRKIGVTAGFFLAINKRRSKPAPIPMNRYHPFLI